MNHELITQTKLFSLISTISIAQNNNSNNNGFVKLYERKNS